MKLIASCFGITLKNLGQEGLDNRMRKNFTSGVKYEEMLGYSRAVKVGNTLYVSGTAGFVGDRIASNTYAQARHAMKKIVKVLKKAGFDVGDVVRTRIYLSRNASWKDVTNVHREYFGKVMPASTVIVCDLTTEYSSK